MEQINKVIKRTDWEVIHKTMVALELTWVDSEEINKIPSIGELVIHAIDLLHHAYIESELHKTDSEFSSGGFLVKAYYIEEKEDVELELYFIITQSASDFKY